MQITLAKTAGFCFGVDRAVNLVYSLLEEGKKVCTLGPLIHNPQVIADLEAKGARIIEKPSQALPDEITIIRTHGVTGSTEEEAAALPGGCCNATCPFVKKIHDIVSEKPTEGSVVLVAGDIRHPEVQGIVGHCREKCMVFSGSEELERVFEDEPELSSREIFAVAQTTFSKDEWEICKKKIKKLCTNSIVFDTICSATRMRQEEAEKLSRENDLMIVIGGRHSSNTAKLSSVCAANCKTVTVERAEELKNIDFSTYAQVGVTAGASTPAAIIKEVLTAMSEVNNTENIQVEEVPSAVAESDDFNAMLGTEELSDESVVKCTVMGITATEIQVAMPSTHALGGLTGLVTNEEYSNNPDADPAKELNVGDVLTLVIMKKNDAEGTVMLSKRRYDAIKAWQDILAAKDSDEILDGVIVEVIGTSGVLADHNGVRVFIPGSHTGLSKDEPLDKLLKEQVRFKIIDISERGNRKRAVGSIRVVSREERREREKAFWDNAAEGQVIVGTVKSLTSYGAFVDVGGVDGMIHISELSWKRIKHPSEIVNVGDTVEVYIKKLDTENKKISLGYKKAEDNPWEILKRDYPVGTVTKAKVVGITSFGAFANVIPGIDGLIHISQLADRRVEKPDDIVTVGEEYDVKITDIDFDKKRVSLSIRALIEPAQEEAEAETEAEAEPEVEAEPETTAEPETEAAVEVEAEAGAAAEAVEEPAEETAE